MSIENCMSLSTAGLKNKMISLECTTGGHSKFYDMYLILYPKAELHCCTEVIVHYGKYETKGIWRNISGPKSIPGSITLIGEKTHQKINKPMHPYIVKNADNLNLFITKKIMNKMEAYEFFIELNDKELKKKTSSLIKEDINKNITLDNENSNALIKELAAMISD